ncbi:MAG: hypothetical protein ACRD5K_13340 [Candidatus Acidiferrales bacterium]
MKRMLFVTPMLLLLACLAPAASAQVSVGVYGDYMRLSQAGTNMDGLGARLGVHIAPETSLEAQMTYDFQQTFAEGFTNTSGGSLTFSNSGLKVLRGLIGPKFQTPGPIHIFITAKGGFINFSFDPATASGPGFVSTIQNLRTNNVHGMFYPGGGLEAQWGPIGLRLDVGDDMYFAGGAHNNLVVQFGPTIHF